MAGLKSPGDQQAGAGLSLTAPATQPDNVLAQNPQPSVASRAVALSSYFLSGALAINLSQFLGTPLYLINQDWYNSWIAFTKQSFGLLTMTLTQTFSPTKVIVSGDESVRGQILRKTDGTLLLDFPERIVLIANHQIYTDWLYLWWTAYCSGMHGRLYIILKESLKRIPVIGWGMQLNQFIFLKRDWEKDRGHMAQALARLNKLADPMWLLLFPEGTNLAPTTRDKSAKWAAKNKMRDMRHCLLPRSTGLRFCLQELENTVGYLYDCTIAYEGVPRGAYAQDIFTLKAGYLEGRPPKSVSMYWRRFAIKDIPIHNEKSFELWLLARWREKDLLIENYLIHGRFPADSGVSKTSQGQLKRGAGHLTVDIRSSHWYEFLQIFAPMGALAMVLYCFYGALPQKFFKTASGKALKETTEDIKTLKSSAPPAPTVPDSFSWDMLFDKDKQEQTFGNAAKGLAQLISSPEASRMMSRADLVQQWLQDPQKLLLESLTEPTEKQNFMKTMQEEQERRKKAGNKHQGSFWKDLEDVESRVNGSVVGRSTSKSGMGTFYKDLEKRQAGLKPAKKSTSFWNDMEKEQNRRTGTVYTMSTLSSSDSRTVINSSNTGTTAVGSSAATPRLAKLPKAIPKKLPAASKMQAAQPTALSKAQKPIPKSTPTKPKSSATTNTSKKPVTKITPGASPVGKPASSMKNPVSTTSKPTTTSAVPKPVASTKAAQPVRKSPPPKTVPKTTPVGPPKVATIKS